ncbi:MAG: HD domain-containing protein [bacterium]|nr:HD domain-containing protein [bacterium]
MKTLDIKDKIYGNFQIDSPIIIELINSKPLQRLKRISQFGVPDEFYHLKNISRYEHSIGVFLLLKSLGASEEEQIAGLLHDVSHTAFSHVIDWVLGEGTDEEFQDAKHHDFINESEIKKILQKYKYDPAKIANHKNFSLLEFDIPNLCADRIDYAIREFPQNIARQCFGRMMNFQRRIVFADQKSAYLFADNFLKRQTEHWGGFEAASRYRLFADALKIALDDKTTNFDDFWKDDEYILKKIKKSKNQKIQAILSSLRNKSLKKFQPSHKVVHKKFRYVDPEFLFNGKLYRLSKADKEFNKKLKQAEKLNKKGVLIPEIN